MTRAKQTNQERSWLDVAFEMLGITPQRIDKTEAPDFLVTIDGRVVGVEVVEARVSAVASERGALDRLTRGIQDGLREAGHALDVALTLRAGCGELLAQDRKELKRHVDTLLALCTEQVQHGLKYREYDGAYLQRVGIPFVAYACVSTWSEPLVGWMMLGTPLQGRDTISAAIDAKATKLSTYRAAAPEVWLLVVAGTGMGSTILIHEARGEFVSSFDRTFYLQANEGECVELTTRPPDPAEHPVS